jgi:membrane glycosyltransferase
MTTQRNASLIRRVIVSTMIMGAALAFILIQRAPGWEPFLITGLAALLSLLLTISGIRGSEPLAFIALAMLVLTMLWDPAKPWGALVGFFLLVLQALKNARIERLEAQHAELMRSQPPPVHSTSVEYDLDA